MELFKRDMKRRANAIDSLFVEKEQEVK